MLMENLNSLDLAKKWMFSFVFLIGEGHKVRFTIWAVLGIFFFFFFWMVCKYILNAFIYLFKKRGKVKHMTAIIQMDAICSFPVVSLNYLLTRSLQENKRGLAARKKQTLCSLIFVRRPAACDIYSRISYFKWHLVSSNVAIFSGVLNTLGRVHHEHYRKPNT